MKSYFKRSLAVLLSLLMVVGLFTVCSVSVLASEAPVKAVLKDWSVDDLAANAEATGTKNAAGNAIYHVGDWIVGSSRTAASEGWFFHDQNRNRGTEFTVDDTLVAKIYFNGKVGSNNSLGFIDFVYENDGARSNRVDLTADVLAAAKQAPGMPEGVLLYEAELDASVYGEKKGNDSLQMRAKSAAGATFNCYGVDLFVKQSDGSLAFFNAVAASASAASGAASNWTLLSEDAVITYTNASNGAVQGKRCLVTETNSEGVRYDSLHYSDNGNNALFSKVAMGTLKEGNYALNFDFATRYGLGNNKFTVDVYAGDEVIYSKLLSQSDYGTNRWSPDSGIRRSMEFPFAVDAAHAGKEFSYTVSVHNQTIAAFFGVELLFNPVNYWTYKDLLADAEEVVADEFDLSETTPIGYQVTGGAGFDGAAALNVPAVTFEEGHVIRFIEKLYAPKGIDHGPLYRVYANGAKIADQSLPAADYNNAAVQEDATYHYLYKEVPYEVTITADMAAASQNAVMGHHFTHANQNFSERPIYFYGFKAYDVTADKLVYEIDGEAISMTGKGGNYTAGPIMAPLAGYNKQVGYQAVAPIAGSPTAFHTFDHYTKALDVAVGDVLKVGVWFMPNNGVTAENGVDLNIKIRNASGQDAEHGLSWRYEDQATLDSELPTKTHETYGFEYKEKIAGFTVTEAQQAILADPNAFGLNLLFGDSRNAGHDWANYPHSVYRFWVYNETQDKYYTDLTGVELASSGGHGTVNETVSVFVGDEAYALNAIVPAGKDLVFDGLTTTLATEGNYIYSFAVTGEEGKKFAVSAYAVDGETVTSLATQEIVATGDAQTVALSFNNTVADQTVVFGLNAAETDLDVAKVYLEENGEVKFSEDELAAKAFEDLVNALPEEIALTDKAAVVAARDAYTALTDAQKALVAEDVLAKLSAAEDTIADLEEAAAKAEADAAAAQGVTNTINALTAESSKEDVAAARAAYKALTEDQKALVAAETLAKLVAAEDAIKALELEAAKAAAYQTVYMINGFNESADLTKHGLTNAALSADKVFSGDNALKMSAEAGATTAFWRTSIDPALDVSLGGKYTNDDLALAFWLYVESADGTMPSLAHLIQICSADNWGQAAGGTKWTANMTTEANKWVYVTIPLKGTSFNPAQLLSYRMTQTAPAENKPAYTYYLDDFQIVNVNATKADEAAAQTVVDAIAALNVQTLDDKAAVEAARAAYEALTDAQKALVTNLAALTAAEEAIADLENGNSEEEDAAAAQAVIDAINALPAELALTDKAAVEAARAAYTALTDAQKALVTAETLAKLTAAEKTIQVLQEAPDPDTVIYETVYMLNDFNTTGGGTNAALSTDRAMSGNSSLKMSATAEQTTSFWKTSMTPVDLSQGGKYGKEDLALAFWLYVDGETSLVHLIQLCSSATGWSNGMHWNKWTSQMVGTTFNKWVYVVIPFATDNTSFDITNFQSYRFTQTTASAAHTYYVDDLQIVRITEDPTDQEVADTVIAQINALPEEIALTDKAAVEAARAAFDALTDDQKALVTNLAALEAAEATIAELQAAADKAAADKAAADAVIAQIAALEVDDLDDKAAVEAARAAFDALTDDQKALVDNLAALEAAEAAIDELQAAADKAAADKAAADAVIAQIAALEVDDLDDKAAVEAARAAFDALTDDQKALVDNLAALEAAEAAIDELQAAADKAAADKAAADAVIAQIAALEVDDLTDKAAVEAARTAFDALTDDQKALVDNLAALEAAEAAIDELQAAADKAAADKAAADAVIAQIAALEVDDLDDKAQVEAARTAFDALTDDQKALVDNLVALEAAETAIAELEQAAADAAAAQAVTDAINALPAEVTEADAEAVAAARVAYNALTDAQKALVAAETVAKLEAAEAALEIDPDQVVADAVIAQINALPAEIALTDKEAVEAARAAYDALTEAQKALVDAETVAKLTAAEATIADLEQQAADAIAVGTFTVMVDALNEESSAEAVAAARAAYEALTEAQKAKVAEETMNKLVALEDALAAAADAAAAQAVTDAITALTEESTEEAVVAAREAYDALTEAQKALVANETLEKLVALEEKFQPIEIAYGDVDGNGKVDAADALKALQHAVKLITLEGDDATAADVNGDDKIDATDALLMLQYTVKLIDEFPVEKAEADDDNTGDDTTGDDTTGDDTTGDDTTGDDTTGDDTTGDDTTGDDTTGDDTTGDDTTGDDTTGDDTTGDDTTGDDTTGDEPTPAE